MKIQLTSFFVAVSVAGILCAPCSALSAAGADSPAADKSGDTASKPSKIIDRVSCSSLCLYKQPAEKAFKAIADMGYRWVDLSCLNWAPHVAVPRLMEDFDKEASRVEKALKENGLGVSNLTFDSFAGRPVNEYDQQFRAVVKLAVTLKTGLINLMAPPPNASRQEIVARLTKLYAIASGEGVRLTLETHCGQITERPADALWLCKQVPGLGLTLDPSHYYAGPNQGANYDELLPYVQGTGFRAGGMSWKEIQLPWGQGPIDFAAVVRKLEARGYKGFYVVEYIQDFSQLDPFAESRKFLAWARGL